ncbi:MAG: rhodanese-like domain-containing protein [Planctomycetota bacterium]
MTERPLNEQGLPDGYPLQTDWEITPRKVKALRDRGEAFVLLDVREAAEVAAASLPEYPGAVWVPMGEIKSRLSDLDEHAEDKVVVMCHHGARSMQVTAFLRQHGFEDVRSMAGGIDLWSRDIDPNVPRY